MRKEVRFLLIGLSAGIVVAVLGWFLYRTYSTHEMQDPPELTAADLPPEQKRMEGGLDALKIKDVSVGSGATIKYGTQVAVHYTGWLYDSKSTDFKGTQFDTSRKAEKSEPFIFRVGAGQVIPGWDRGIVGMKQGGRRTLYIPANLAYGERGAGGVIPPNATLVFDVELVDVKSKN